MLILMFLMIMIMTSIAMMVNITTTTWTCSIFVMFSMISLITAGYILLSLVNSFLSLIAIITIATPYLFTFDICPPFSMTTITMIILFFFASWTVRKTFFMPSFFGMFFILWFFLSSWTTWIPGYMSLWWFYIQWVCVMLIIATIKRNANIFFVLLWGLNKENT